MNHGHCLRFQATLSYHSHQIANIYLSQIHAQIVRAHIRFKLILNTVCAHTDTIIQKWFMLRSSSAYQVAGPGSQRAITIATTVKLCQYSLTSHGKFSYTSHSVRLYCVLYVHVLALCLCTAVALCGISSNTIMTCGICMRVVWYPQSLVKTPPPL